MPWQSWQMCWRKPLDMLYSDQDVWEAGGERSHPFFKPDWSPDTFRSFSIRAIWRRIAQSCAGGSASHAGTILPVVTICLRRLSCSGHKKIGHIPEVLCHEEGDYQYIEGSCLSDRTETGNGGKTAGKVSIIIPSKDPYDHSALVSGFAGAVWHNFSQWAEIIVVDNGSCEGREEAAGENGGELQFSVYL